MLQNAFELGLHLRELRHNFLPQKKIEELNEPENFENDLAARAFLVLAHSAFEQFFEDTAADFAAAAIDRWMRSRTPTKQLVVTIACMSATVGELPRSLDLSRLGDGGSEDRSGALTSIEAMNPRAKLTRSLQDGIAAFKLLLDKNHGADIHYLNAIFVPLGVEIRPPPDAMSALRQIANARGTFAHRRTAKKQGKFAYQPIAVEKALVNAEQLFLWCISLETELRNSLLPDYTSLTTMAKIDAVEKLVQALGDVRNKKNIIKMQAFESATGAQSALQT